MGVCACPMTRNKRTSSEREGSEACIPHGTSFICFMPVDVCCMGFIWMLYGFHLDVVCVSFGCCNGYTCMLQVYVSNVLSILDVCCTCFIWMLYMFQWLYTYVASVYSKCFISFRRMLQVFYLDAAYVAVAIHML